jgi:sec-independent protein translocase protein TatB
MSLPDTIFIFGLALVIFGPKKLPEIGRQLGKLVLEFRRASNEFKMQIEEELRAADEQERQRKLAAQAAASAAATAAPSESPAESPATPTIRPPSTGTQVSTESPSHAYSNGATSTDLEAGSTDAHSVAVTNDAALEEQTTNHHG